MPLLRSVAIGACLLLAGCANIPDTYAPPVQRDPQTAPEPLPFGHFVSMSDPNAGAYIVRDIQPASGLEPWRWTGQRPELRFLLTTTENLRFAMDFALPEATFTQRGSVTIAVTINGHALDKVRCEKPGQQHFEKPVPPEWLRTHLPNIVSAEIDKLWVSPGDGARLGFVLSRAGFIE